MNQKDIKPIPEYIIKRIKKADLQLNPQNGTTRYFSYLALINKQISKVTVAVRNYRNEWYCKQCAVHSIYENIGMVKDMCFTYLGGYQTGWHDMGIYQYSRWYEDGKWYFCEAKHFNVYAPIVNLEYLKRFSRYRYCAFELYKDKQYHKSVLKYLRLYEEYPQMEYLMKFGLQELAMRKTILRKVAKDRNFVKWLLQYREYIKKNFYYVSSFWTAYRKKVAIEVIENQMELKYIAKYGNDCQLINRVFINDRERFEEYVEQQQTNKHSYADYLKACIWLKIDINKERNRYPYDFKYWHDVRVDQYAKKKAQRSELLRLRRERKFARVAEKYVSLQRVKKEPYVCLIAKQPKELEREGETLHHCVGYMNYDGKFMREESLIFFIRTKNKPDRPFVTVEYSLKTQEVLQCQGNKHSQPSNAVMHYVNKIWLPYANRQLQELKQIAA